MPIYEYECESCGSRFELQQSIMETTITECPKCQGKVRRLVSGGAGFILKGSGHGRASQNRGECSFENGGKTCCGRNERCEKPSCGDKS